MRVCFDARLLRCASASLRVCFVARLANKRQTTTHNNIRNLAVVAHVDHGKTTLSDALLLKAGLLHKERAGDQNKGRSLDTLKDERDRGITIKSAAVTLAFEVKEHVLAAGVPATNILTDPPASGGDLETADVYIGCLPRDFSEQSLCDVLTSAEIRLGSIQSFGQRRGYAIVRVPIASLESLLALDGSAVGGVSIVVQKCGDIPMIRLKHECNSRGIEMPSITVLENPGAGFTGKAVWPGLGGGVMVIAPAPLSTAKQARQAAANECLDFLDRQRNNHEAPQGIVGNARKDEETDKTCHEGGMAPVVINLIDTPGHIDFNAEVTAALRVSDGCLLVVDAVEGMAVQTKEVLKQALREGVKPVLVLNKVDRLLLDKQQDALEVYDSMLSVIDDVNAFIGVHRPEHFDDWSVSFEEGSVCFGSGYFGWSCSIDTMIDDTKDRMLQREFLSKRENFANHIIKPILRMHRICGVLPTKKELDQTARVTLVGNFLSKKIHGWSAKRLVGAHGDVASLEPRSLLKKAMMAWIPAADALVDMVAAHVPSPAAAQSMRAVLLYSGDMADDSGQGIQRCDPAGPSVIYVSKITQGDNKNTVAFGRVFSGTIRPGDTLRALRTNGTESTCRITSIKICGLGGMSVVPEAHAGQLVALAGIDNALQKAGTLTSDPRGQSIRHMNFTVSAIVQHAVRPKDKRCVGKMVTGFNRVVNTDSTALFFKDAETNEHILAGAGELHIEVLLSSFAQDTGIEIDLSDPIICYRETARSPSVEAVLAKSENKHNRIWIKASPVDDAVIEAMTSGNLVGISNAKEFAKRLTASFGWDRSESSRIWSIGPEPLNNSEEGSPGSNAGLDQRSCLLVDSTFGLQIPEDFKANIIAAFLQVVRRGILVNAPMRGVRFDLVDAKFHADAVHRRPNSVVPAASRAMSAAFLQAEPSLMEPVYNVTITGGSGTLNGAYALLGHRGGSVVDLMSTATSDTIQGRVPVRCSFGLSAELQRVTRGHGQCACMFGGMRAVPSLQLGNIIAGARKQKGLSDDVPSVDALADKL